jgi:hypothetical protein
MGCKFCGVHVGVFTGHFITQVQIKKNAKWTTDGVACDKCAEESPHKLRIKLWEKK